MALAWHVAAFQRRKRLPPLRSVLKKMDPDELTEAQVEGAREAHGDIAERLA